MGNKRLYHTIMNYTNITALIFDNETNRLYDVSQIVSNIKVDTSIFDTPGKCTFDILRLPNFTFKEGATFALTVDTHKVFKGYVFERKQTDSKASISVTCYDALRYFKNKDSKTFNGLMSWQIAQLACSDMVLPFSLVSASLFPTSPIVHDNKTYFEMIKHALDETLINTGAWCIIRDNFGVIEHCNVLSLRAPFLISDKTSIIKYDYTTSIDTDTYNQIKLYRDNDQTSSREVFIVNDTAVNGGENIRKWGILQMYEKVDDNLNIAQIEQRALGMLFLYNNTKKSLKISETLGFFPMAAGYVFPVRIEGLQDETINQWMLCTDCSHTINKGIHTMSITAEVVNGEWS